MPDWFVKFIELDESLFVLKKETRMTFQKIIQTGFMEIQLYSDSSWCYLSKNPIQV